MGIIGTFASRVKQGQGMDPQTALQLAIGDFRQHATAAAVCLVLALNELKLDSTGNLAESQLDEIEEQILRCGLGFARLRARVREYRKANPAPFPTQKGSAS